MGIRNWPKTCYFKVKKFSREKMISRKKISMYLFMFLFFDFSDLILTEWLVFNSMIFILFLVVMTRLWNCGTLLFVDNVFVKMISRKNFIFYILFFKSIMIKKNDNIVLYTLNLGCFWIFWIPSLHNQHFWHFFG